MRNTKQASKRTERGAALVELALILPFAILLLSGVIQAGNILSQLSWAAQSGYNIASALAVSSRETGIAVMALRENQASEWKHSVSPNLNLQQMEVSPLSGGDYLGTIVNGRPAVGVRFTTFLRPLSGSTVAIPLSIDIVSPHLAASLDTTGFGTGANAPVLVDCCGRLCTQGVNTCRAHTNGAENFHFCDPNAVCS